MFRCAAVTGAVLSVLCGVLLLSLPHPYEGLHPVALTLDRQARLPSFPPDLTSGAVRLNDRLTRSAVRLLEGKVYGSESVGVTPDGEVLFLLDKFGWVFRAKVDDVLRGGDVEKVGYIGPGRPLGFHVENSSRLVVCDALKGLLLVDLSPHLMITILANTVDRKPLHYLNDLDIRKSDGTIYFSSSTQERVAVSPEGYYDTMRSYLLNTFYGVPTGRLLEYIPSSREVRVLVDDLWYANGVAATEDSVYIVETNGFRVLRHWTRGPRKGSTEEVITNLAGFPDGISLSEDGKHLWLTLVAPLSPIVPLLPYTLVRSLLSRLIPLFHLFVKPWGCVVKLTLTGEVVDVLMDPSGSRVSTVSAATESRGRLFLGNLNGDHISYIDL